MPEEKKQINRPDAKVHKKPFSIEELEAEAKKRSDRIKAEFANAFSFIKNYPKSITFFGSSRTKPTGRHYKEAKILAGRIVKELGYAVITGGGPGIVEAANRGAYEAGGQSVGINITLQHSQIKNDYTTDSLQFYYFFSRKAALSFSAEAFVFFPGGFGTLDEFFEIVTLIQTEKIVPVPIILFGSDYWLPLNKFMLKNMYNAHKAIDKKDMSMYTITDSLDEAMRIIKKAPLRRGN